jgi:TPR repeat protein
MAADPGPLDQPLPVSSNQRPGKPGAVSLQVQSVSRPSNPVAAQHQLRAEVAKEQIDLEKLTRDELVEKAENGERAAQVVLGADYAKEATLLSFAPDAANDALSDAAKWYSLAASRGYPGAASLDISGIRFYPIRIQRKSR